MRCRESGRESEKNVARSLACGRESGRESEKNVTELPPFCCRYYNEKNRHEVAKLGKDIADLKHQEMLADKRQLAEEMRRLGQENKYFKKLLKTSLEAQELTYEALCGAGDGNGGLGMVVSAVNGLPRVKSVLPGGAACAALPPRRCLQARYAVAIW